MKEKQRALIIEIMKADEESGLYTTRKQTAVDWLFNRLWETPKDKFTWHSILEKAKKMEKEQVKDAYADGINYDYTDLDIEFGISNSDREYHAEQYYKQTYEQP